MVLRSQPLPEYSSSLPRACLLSGALLGRLMSNDGSALATFAVTVKVFFFHHNKTEVVIGVTQVRTSLHFGKGGGVETNFFRFPGLLQTYATVPDFEFKMTTQIFLRTTKLEDVNACGYSTWRGW